MHTHYLFGEMNGAAKLLAAFSAMPVDRLRTLAARAMAFDVDERCRLQLGLAAWDGNSGLQMATSRGFEQLTLHLLPREHPDTVAFTSSVNKRRQQRSIPLNSWLWRQNVQYM